MHKSESKSSEYKHSKQENKYICPVQRARPPACHQQVEGCLGVKSWKPHVFTNIAWTAKEFLPKGCSYKAVSQMVKTLKKHAKHVHEAQPARQQNMTIDARERGCVEIP